MHSNPIVTVAIPVYNVEGYVRHKHDHEDTIKRMKRDGEIVYSDSEGTVDYTQMFDDSIIKMWMPLCEALARKFATSQQASGVMDITDLISCGYLGLCKAVKKLDRQMLADSEDTEKTIKSFLSKRIRGAIRREIDKNRGDMRIPEHKYNEIRKKLKRICIFMLFCLILHPPPPRQWSGSGTHSM